MIVEIKIPGVGESVKEAVLAQWFKKDEDFVEKDEPLFVIETDKVTLEVTAEVSGTLKIRSAAGETVAVGSVVGTLDTESVKGKAIPPEKKHMEQMKVAEPPEKKPEKAATSPEIRAPETASSEQASIPSEVILPPSVRRLIAEKHVDIRRITGTGPGGRITKLDVLLHLEQAPVGLPEKPTPTQEVPAETGKGIFRKPMSPIRRRIAERLLEAKQSTAMLTTFNEIDMSRVTTMRQQYKEAFEKKHGVALGFMSFFVKASVEALKEVPEINAFIDGGDIVYHDYHHIGVAVGSERGLVVPVIRHAERLSFAEIERAIADYVKKIRENKLELADLEGGTFTISNGGVFGSLLSTPILNTPQSGILGMHKIEKRPVVIDDEIVIRPMMYVALSYDHRIVDGRGAVTCLKRIKEYIEHPERMMLEI